MRRKWLVLAAALVLTTNAIAEQEIQIPVINYAVPAEGVKIDYSMLGAQTQKVVCLFNFYKGSVSYVENGKKVQGPIIGETQQIVFTSKGKTLPAQGLDNLDQFHVDPRSSIYLEAGSNSTGTATCFYQSES